MTQQGAAGHCAKGDLSGWAGRRVGFRSPWPRASIWLQRAGAVVCLSAVLYT